MEEQILIENIISKDHLNDIYNLFVTLCGKNEYKIIPFNFIEIFNTISEKRNLNIDKEIWNKIFCQIDFDKDGVINFQDFLRYIYYNLRVILGEIGEKSSYNKLK